MALANRCSSCSSGSCQMLAGSSACMAPKSSGCSSKKSTKKSMQSAIVRKHWRIRKLWLSRSSFCFPESQGKPQAQCKLRSGGGPAEVRKRHLALDQVLHGGESTTASHLPALISSHNSCHKDCSNKLSDSLRSMSTSRTTK